MRVIYLDHNKLATVAIEDADVIASMYVDEEGKQEAVDTFNEDMQGRTVNGHAYINVLWGEDADPETDNIEDQRVVGDALIFQNGPINQFDVNGTTNESVIAALIDRLTLLNEKFPCDENEQALSHLQSALEALESRTKDRLARQVEGQDVA